MKTYKAYITLTAALILAACTAEDDFRTQTSDEVVQVSALIATEVQSRVNTEGDGKAFSSGDVITLQNTSRTDKNVGNYKYENSTWSPTGDAYVLWKGTENNNFQAWYPADATYTKFTIPDDQSGTNLPTADWMTATGTAKRDDGSVALAFTHLLSKVTVTISSYGTEYGDATKTISDFRINTLATEMTAAYEGGTTVTGTGASTAITPYEGTNSYTAVVAPGAYSGTFLTLNVKVGEGEAKAMTVTAPAGLTLEYGKAYAFNLKVGKDKAELGTVSVTPWNEENNGLGNIQATEVKVTTVIEGSTATITIPDVATDAMVQNAMNEFTADGLTTIIVEGPLNETRQGCIATALVDKTVTLYLTHLAEEELIDELASTDDGITVNCGYYMADASTYVAYNADGLQAWNTYAQANPTTNLSLGKDITLPLAEGETSNWTSVGTETTPYTGTVNGNGYSITGMTINQTTNNAGFIGYLGENGAVKNLKLKAVSVTTTGDYVGGLVGYSFSVIENCAVEGGTISTSASEGPVGGIVGRAEGKYSAPALIVACHNTAAVSGKYHVGGIIGNAGLYSRVIACYNSGTITRTGSWRCGGIAGYFRSATTYSCCNYNTGTITGKTAIAGTTPDRGYHNYWSSDHEYANESNTEGQYNNDGATKITSASEWQTAMTTMNTWLAENGYAYSYVLNTDAATKEAHPLVIVEVSEL